MEASIACSRLHETGRAVASAGMWTDLDRPPLDEAALRRALLPPFAALDVLPVVGSTNTELAERARAGAADRTVLIAEHQSAGRGRAARSWQAPARSGLAVSVLLRPERAPQSRWGWLPLLTGLALGDVVVELGELPATLKWPNDLLIGPGSRKAAGILAEVVSTPDGPAVVLGVGLNVTLRADELPVPAATSLLVEGAECTDRDPLLRALLRRLDASARQWDECAGDPVTGGLLDAYRERCATVGRRVSVELPAGEVVHGTAVDVDTDGRLVVTVEPGGGQRALSAGDVTHLRTA